MDPKMENGPAEGEIKKGQDQNSPQVLDNILAADQQEREKKSAEVEASRTERERTEKEVWLERAHEVMDKSQKLIDGKFDSYDRAALAAALEYRNPIPKTVEELRRNVYLLAARKLLLNVREMEELIARTEAHGDPLLSNEVQLMDGKRRVEESEESFTFLDQVERGEVKI